MITQRLILEGGYPSGLWTCPGCRATLTESRLEHDDTCPEVAGRKPDVPAHLAAVDPLTVACSHCDAEPGQRCMAVSDWARKPHAVRRRDALAIAAHADPVLDEVRLDRGPCLLCGVKGLGARHRDIDAIAGSLAAGDDPETCAEEYGVSLEAVGVVQAWAEKWPGAWN